MDPIGNCTKREPVTVIYNYRVKLVARRKSWSARRLGGGMQVLRHMAAMPPLHERSSSPAI